MAKDVVNKWGYLPNIRRLFFGLIFGRDQKERTPINSPRQKSSMSPPSSLHDFKKQLVETEPLALAQAYVLSDKVHALQTTEAYEVFRKKVLVHLGEVDYVAIVGSGNWRFSLNPEKLMVEYHDKSDIDVAIVSQRLYQETWDEMRAFQRNRWYSMAYTERQRLSRNGQNIYSGFACPIWIPQVGHPAIYSFKSMLNKLSGPEVGYREVKMLFFKNEIEMIDYYRRGFTEAKRELSK